MKKTVTTKPKTGLFSHDQREKLRSTDPNVKLTGEQKSKLYKIIILFGTLLAQPNPTKPKLLLKILAGSIA